MAKKYSIFMENLFREHWNDENSQKIYRHNKIFVKNDIICDTTTKTKQKKNIKGKFIKH